jgi:hypothetical protein
MRCCSSSWQQRVLARLALAAWTLQCLQRRQQQPQAR